MLKTALIIVALLMMVPVRSPGVCQSITIGCGACLRGPCPYGGSSTPVNGQLDDCNNGIRVECSLGQACGTGGVDQLGHPTCSVQSITMTGVDCKLRIVIFVSGTPCCTYNP